MPLDGCRTHALGVYVVKRQHNTVHLGCASQRIRSHVFKNLGVWQAHAIVFGIVCSTLQALRDPLCMFYVFVVSYGNV